MVAVIVLGTEVGVQDIVSKFDSIRRLEGRCGGDCFVATILPEETEIGVFKIPCQDSIRRLTRAKAAAKDDE